MSIVRTEPRTSPGNKLRGFRVETRPNKKRQNIKVWAPLAGGPWDEVSRHLVQDSSAGRVQPPTVRPSALHGDGFQLSRPKSKFRLMPARSVYL